jgi:hypothetical protein
MRKVASSRMVLSLTTEFGGATSEASRLDVPTST